MDGWASVSMLTEEVPLGGGLPGLVLRFQSPARTKLPSIRAAMIVMSSTPVAGNNVITHPSVLVQQHKIIL
jgi:hypothetical protein